MKLATTQCLMFLVIIHSIQGSSEAGLLLGFNESNYEAVSGGTVDVQLILQDTMLSDFAGFDDPLFSGLVGGGGRILQTGGLASLAVSGSGISTPFSFLTTTYPFDSGFPVADPANVAGVLGAVDFFNPPLMPSPDNSILIGTFQLTITGLPGQTATISADQLSPSLEENTTFLASLDPLIDSYGVANISVSDSNLSPVPEPSAFVLFLIGCLLTGTGIARHRRIQNVSCIHQ
ncbi:PEP-CTERM sorting domain-containing protein [Thalassoroseus pseudoceratinae]|uniref:PEP-CTERM sorting domain-containing protein n=1 Tax=Thalassoroseus pseudoceratinae TaxID=2713176 RepID=UPI0014236089|nr:PEP-CTERM sorting domain-containing protein [Thalassoroseus pseudoceratinae]